MNTITEGLEDIRNGKMIIITDDEKRENEGDLFICTRHVTADAVNFMAHYGCGLICVPMEMNHLKKLEINTMVPENTDMLKTAFTVSVDHIDTTTGISAAERSHTIRKLADISSASNDFRRPGHIFPLASREGGVLVRPGHTEAAVDLSRLAFNENCDLPSGVICEIMNEDGTMARMENLENFSLKYGLKIISIADLIHYRKFYENLIIRNAETLLPTEFGKFKLAVFTEIYTGKEHLALYMGDISDGKPVLCRVHSECLTGDALGSVRCDCGPQYQEAMRRIAEEKRGILIYLRQEGRGIGFLNKIRAYALQDTGSDTVDANIRLGFAPDMRDYYAGFQILKNMGINKIRLMTNNPAKITGLLSYGIDITEHLPIRIKSNIYNKFYLDVKRSRMGHMLDKENTNIKG